MATSFDLPNYVGDLFRMREKPNNFLRLIGGLAGAVRLVNATEFPMGVEYEVPTGTQQSKLEGATPTAQEIGTTQSTNVIQIFQESVELTYTRQSVSEAIGGLAIVPGGNQPNLLQPGTLAWQIDRRLEKIQNDMNWNFLRGAYQKPVDNTTGRQTRGILTAITTNAVDAGTAAVLSKTIFAGAIKTMVDNGAMNLGGELFAVCDAFQYGALAALYEGATTLPESRSIAGVAVRTIVTTFGVVHLVYEPDMPAGQIMLLNAAKVRPVAMPIVADGMNKGVLFAEPLAKTKSADTYQVYGEWGVDYSHEYFHGKIVDLATT
jgi:hypothetical protein